ncbi:MAG: hypothetical protein ACRD08_21240 [Acidimicrobiales bacterium]
MTRSLAITALLSAACATADAPPALDLNAPLNTPFTVEIGHSAVLTEPAVTITFTAVPQDSRCPVDAVCIWAGDAVVALTLHVGPPDGDGPDVKAELHTNLEPRSTPWGPYYELQLLDLQPVPRLHPPPSEPYRATLVMESRSGRCCGDGPEVR